MSSIHRPRKKKKTTNGSLHSDHGAVITDHENGVQAPAFPLAAFFWPARKSASPWVILPLSLMVVGLFRWAVGFWGYSGKLSDLFMHSMTDNR
jgi:alpha-1,3-glucosyltransferase